MPTRLVEIVHTESGRRTTVPDKQVKALRAAGWVLALEMVRAKPVRPAPRVVSSYEMPDDKATKVDDKATDKSDGSSES